MLNTHQCRINLKSSLRTYSNSLSKYPLSERTWSQRHRWLKGSVLPTCLYIAILFLLPAYQQYIGWMRGREKAIFTHLRWSTYSFLKVTCNGFLLIVIIYTSFGNGRYIDINLHMGSTANHYKKERASLLTRLLEDFAFREHMVMDFTVRTLLV